MKITFKFPSCLKFLICAVLNVSIGLSESAAQTISKPRESLDYESLFLNPPSWQQVSKTLYSYDAKGQLTQSLFQNPNSGQDRNRITYLYDQAGTQIQRLRELWQNNRWETTDGSRYVNTYDSNGKLLESVFQETSNGLMPNWRNVNRTVNTYDANKNLLESVSQEFSATTQTWQNTDRDVYTYNSHNLKITNIFSQWNSTANGWKQLSRTTYTYDQANEIVGYVTEEYVNGAWRPFCRFSNLIWEKLNELPKDYTVEYWQNGSWHLSQNVSKKIQPNGSWVELTVEYLNGAWQNKRRMFFDRDSLGNDTGKRIEEWQNGAWLQIGGERTVLTYNSNNDITEKVFQLFSGNPQTYLSFARQVFSNFQYFTIAGLRKEIPQEISATIYPNPVQNFLNIELPEISANTNIQLTDLTGKVVLTRNFKASEGNQLNLENLQAGVYLLTLETDKGKTVRKIVKN